MNPGVPDWYLNPPQDPDFIYGIASAKMQDMDRSRRAAEHRARNGLAQTLNVHVQNMTVEYNKEAGTAGDMASVQLFEDISRQLSVATLSGATIARRHIAPDGTIFVLATYPKNAAKTTARGMIENAASRAATIKKDAALKAMDTAFDSLVAPRPVESD
jgi:hypothetical protein